jgi:hypothetical protein
MSPLRQLKAVLLPFTTTVDPVPKGSRHVLLILPGFLHSAPPLYRPHLIYTLDDSSIPSPSHAASRNIGA